MSKKNLLRSPALGSDLLTVLRERFERNMHRHKNVEWDLVQVKIEKKKNALQVLGAMEQTGGEPDVVGFDKKTNTILFVDCSPESPAGRRSLCYDRAALNARKEFKPKDSAIDLAKAIGINILTEAEYRELQTLGEFDLKSSSWILTPDPIRKLGGALFCDRRYETVFVYHNGAESYYAARGFRGSLRV